MIYDIVVHNIVTTCLNVYSSTLPATLLLD